jgi:hypothetical protein
VGVIQDELEGSQVGAERRRASFVLHFAGGVQVDTGPSGAAVELGYEQLQHLEYQLLQLRLRAPKGTAALPESTFKVERSPRSSKPMLWSTRYNGPDMSRALSIFEKLREELRQGAVQLVWLFPGKDPVVVGGESAPNLRSQW